MFNQVSSFSLTCVHSCPRRVCQFSTCKIKRKEGHTCRTLVSLHVNKWKSLFKLWHFTWCPKESCKQHFRKWTVLGSWEPAVNQRCLPECETPHPSFPSSPLPLLFVLLGSRVTASIMRMLGEHGCAMRVRLVPWQVWNLINATRKMLTEFS